MAKKLLHRCICVHARVHVHFLRRVWNAFRQLLLSTMHMQVCTLDRCCEPQRTHLLHARYRMLHLESSKRNYYIISFWTIIKAIFTSLHADSAQKYVWTCIYTYTYTHMHVHIHMHTCIHIYTYTYTYTYTYIYTWIHIHIHTHIYVHIYKNIHMHIHIYISLYLSHMHIL